MGRARAPVVGSGRCPAWICRVSKDQPSFMSCSWVLAAEGGGPEKGVRQGPAGRTGPCAAPARARRRGGVLAVLVDRRRTTQGGATGAGGDRRARLSR